MEIKNIKGQYFDVAEAKSKRHNMQSLLHDLASMEARIQEFTAKKAGIQELIDAAKKAGMSDELIIKDEDDE